MRYLLSPWFCYGLVSMAIAVTGLSTQARGAIASTQHLSINSGTQIAYSPDTSVVPGLLSPTSTKLDMKQDMHPIKGYILPTKGTLTSGFGQRWGRTHSGIDISAPTGTPIVAAASGVVVTAGWNEGGYGNLVKIQHPDGALTLYAHNSRILVQPGQQVAQGELIAEMGSTGYSTGSHCHFEIRLPQQGAVNPLAYLPHF